MSQQHFCKNALEHFWVSTRSPLYSPLRRHLHRSKSSSSISFPQKKRTSSISPPCRCPFPIAPNHCSQASPCRASAALLPAPLFPPQGEGHHRPTRAELAPASSRLDFYVQAAADASAARCALRRLGEALQRSTHADCPEPEQRDRPEEKMVNSASPLLPAPASSGDNLLPAFFQSKMV